MLFLANESLDPPLAARAERAAKSIDASAFEGFGARKAPCSDEQRATMREFLRLADIEFDDGGWEELMGRKDAQQLLAAALWEGVRKAKVAAVTVAFCQIRARIEASMTEPTFVASPDPQTPPPHPEDPPSKRASTRRRPSSEDAARAREVLRGDMIDWSGVETEERDDVCDALRKYLEGLGVIGLSWYAKPGVGVKFIKRMVECEREGGGRHLLCYAIEERNGAIARLDGVFRYRESWYVSPLPIEEVDAAGSDD